MNKFYKKTIYFVSLFMMLLVVTFIPFSFVSANMTPTISLTNVDSNGNVQITVYGDASSPVVIYPNSYSNSTQIGYTNNNGYFSSILSNSQYNLSSGASVYVTVNGIASQAVIWPYNNYYNYYNNNTNNSITFSQNNVTFSNTGLSNTVTIYGGLNNSYYISNNSTIVNATINGNVITLYSNQVGNATLTICSNNSSTCGYLYVTVSSNSNQTYYSNYNPIYTPVYNPIIYNPTYYNISLSQSSLNLYVGSNKSISIYGNGNYYVYNNSNPYAVSASVNNNILSVYANSAGSSSIIVCAINNSGPCATLNVTVSNRPVFSMTQPFRYFYYQPFNFMHRYMRWW